MSVARIIVIVYGLDPCLNDSAISISVVQNPGFEQLFFFLMMDLNHKNLKLF